jgi:predicted short-subunit dehydrogenase-like oxidoreductase (DUF2520 family)
MIGIVGGGRMGRALAQVLVDAGERVELWSRREAGLATGGEGPTGALAGAAVLLLAVPDDAIADVAVRLAQYGAIEASQVVLHLSGLHDARVLRALAPAGPGLGSFHPLQTITDPAEAAKRWRGSYVAVEGDARAIAAGEGLAALLGLIPIRLAAEAKVVYHLGAVLAANYVVALVGMANRLAAAAGVPPEIAAVMYRPLVLGAAESLQLQPPAKALTGPVRRGDAETVRTHLEALEPEARGLYARLGLEALRLAREAGLDPGLAARMEQVLRDY